MPERRYDLLAVDLDGTLIDHAGRVSDVDLAALREARAAGMVVTICTGRALIECREVIQRLEQTDPVIVSGGSLVACPGTERTLERFAMPPALVARVSAYLHEREHPAVVLKDSDATGYDYLAVSPRGPAALDAASRWWFENMRARVRHVPSIAHDEHPEDTIRIGAYAANRPINDLVEDVQHAFAGEVVVQHFNGVQLPDERNEHGITSVHIAELFHPHACKGQALARLAARLGVPIARTAAIGDQTNDLSMITGAGLGIAMGNANDTIKAAAKRHTHAVTRGGVAHAVRQMLDGAW